MIAIPLFISSTEIFFILLVVVLVFGSDKIPEIARGLAKAMNSVRHATDGIKNEISKSVDEHGISTDVKQIQEQINEVKDQIEETGSIKRPRR
jgi:sec-independent protein translocase protein TatA